MTGQKRRGGGGEGVEANIKHPYPDNDDNDKNVGDSGGGGGSGGWDRGWESGGGSLSWLEEPKRVPSCSCHCWGGGGGGSGAGGGGGGTESGEDKERGVAEHR
ncbi:hypothetical protein HZH66_012173 [Vespula vulgaris]|uniref:Uncharacterized protein n=1 Tax=Vespula vulgaris TaxID=7454 RepID=A0A834JBW6_VESVU|nr:hypothetical protein HZH66_012173 [Vespula vulgaris]